MLRVISLLLAGALLGSQPATAAVTELLQSVPGPWLGTYARPFPTVQDGITAIFDGGDTPALPTLHITGQNYPEQLTVSKRMKIVACGGTAVIGG